MEDSKVLQDGFKGDTQEETDAAKIVREFYKEAAKKYDLEDRAIVPGVLTVTLVKAIEGLRKALEAKEDGEVISFDFMSIPTYLGQDENETTSKFIDQARGIWLELATAIDEHVGCKHSVEPQTPVYDKIVFH